MEEPIIRCKGKANETEDTEVGKLVFSSKSAEKEPSNMQFCKFVLSSVATANFCLEQFLNFHAISKYYFIGASQAPKIQAQLDFADVTQNPRLA